MLLVILGVSVALISLGYVLYKKSYDHEELGIALQIVFGVIAIGSLIATATVGILVSRESIIDQEIQLCEEYNAKIEANISSTVENYMQHEKDVFIEVAPESSITLIVTYPELKSDALIEKQIYTYMSNDAKIMELKREKIYFPVLKWWLYFGK